MGHGFRVGLGFRVRICGRGVPQVCTLQQSGVMSANYA